MNDEQKLFVSTILKQTKSYPLGTNVQDRISILNEHMNIGKISLVKTLRGWFGIGLREAKELSETICEWENGYPKNVNNNLIRILAAGKMTPDVSGFGELRKGINASLRNWKNLGFDSPQDAVIDFLYRSKGDDYKGQPHCGPCAC